MKSIKLYKNLKSKVMKNLGIRELFHYKMSLKRLKKVILIIII